LKKDQLVTQYLDYLEKVNRSPRWVYKFTDYAGISKEDYYQHFDDINQLEQFIWQLQLAATLKVLYDDPGYPEYRTREKLLAFYFTLFEILNERKGTMVAILKKSIMPGITPVTLSDFKSGFQKFVLELISEGFETGEIERRPLLDTYYPDALWMQCLFLLRFWKSDQSTGHSATDEAIERSANLLYDLLGYTPIDASMGFARFLYKNKKQLF